MCYVWSKVWTVWSRLGEHGRLGSLKAVSVLCVFGLSLFGIRARFCVSNLSRTCRCLDRMIVEDHVFVQRWGSSWGAGASGDSWATTCWYIWFHYCSERTTGAVILHFLGFGVVRLVRIDPNEARVGDIVVEVVHSGFYTCAQVWLKVIDGARGWASTSDLQTNFYFTSYLA